MDDTNRHDADEGRVAELARTLWDYLRVGETPEPADAILVFGSRDVRPGEWGGRLFLDGIAPLLVCSGGRGRYTHGWPRPEAEALADEARRVGVPAGSIILEDRSTNTGENVIFTRRLLEARGIDPARWILVHVPFMERRVRATFRRYWPGREARVTSPPIPFEEYFEQERGYLLGRMCGEIARMVEYPARGFQVPEDRPVPEAVLAARRELAALGWDGEK